MARCYHDDQDFESGLTIEVAREIDILPEGHDLNKFPCVKNPGHSGFIPFKDLTLEQIPLEVRSTETLDSIKRWGNTVVRLVVDKIKNGSLVKEVGSGYVYNDGNKYYIQTNNHVVKTDAEVKNCTVEFFYDSQDRSNVLTCRGVKLVYTCPYKDLSFFLFHPVPEFLHQLNELDPILPSPSIVIVYTNNTIVTCRSNPRFRPPNLFYFTSENLNNPEIKMMFMSSSDGSISYMYFKSSYFKFQPTPSNIKELSSIEIHIYEDDGKSKVIPGNVVKFNDEFVVKIPEYIFQDEVKKCRLVWNGKVISRGTRLYFQQIKSKEFFNGDSEIDRDLDAGQTSPYMWVFDIDPLPRRAVQINEMVNGMSMDCILCCIGHPHGSFKMVTFGRWFGKTIGHFDNQYRRIARPGNDCKCKMVSCVRYSCKTCVGSSGFPVFIANNASPMSGCRSHFMGERVKALLPNGELIENLNSAWG